jgi:signal transduction histidine kinase
MGMNSRLKPTVGILFIVSIFIPSLSLGFFALRAVDREEAYIEKQLEQTLLAEVLHTISLLDNDLKMIHNELLQLYESSESGENGLLRGENGLLPGENTLLPGEAGTVSGESYPLIAVPFLVTDDFVILQPGDSSSLPGNQDDSRVQEDFLEKNRQFLSNKEAVPVYENIAVAYKKTIMEEQEAVNDTSSAGSTSTDNSANSFYNEDGSLNDDVLTQNAIIQFEQDEDVRNKIYEQAAEEGREVGKRNVKEIVTKEKDPESIFITRDLTFSDIVSRKKSGFIPRFARDTLTLLFWYHSDNGYIAGCSLETTALLNRLSRSIRHPYSDVRFLTILDEKGLPSLIPGQMDGQDWKVPFVSREIHEILPGWEVAAYLTHPDIISSRAKTVALILWSLIFLFIISIITGGILILKSLYSEMILAQQKTTFVSNVSHELKTPLTSIRLFAEMLKEGKQQDTEKQRKYLEIMVSETDRLSKLINNVLDFSKMSRNMKQYCMEEVDIIGLARDLVENQRLRLEQKGFLVEFSSPPGEIYILADREALEQALLNLLSNAEKYSPEKKEMKLTIIHDDKSLRLELCDRGMGIPSQHGKRIFKEFYRGHDSLSSGIQGSGLGLSITHKIIHAHNGTIMYKPNPGGGSIFIIILPRLHKGKGESSHG